MKEKSKQGKSAMTGNKPRKLVSFDWAMKKLLRSKANFGVLEGFLSELLKDDIEIEEVLESESNKEDALNKYNRVDLQVKDSRGQRIIIEVQYDSQVDYFHRILFGTSRVVGETLKESRPYADVVKVISVSIVWFDLGQGNDYVYVGGTEFQGMHTGDRLHLSAKQQRIFEKEHVTDIFPTYYILRVNAFDDIAKDGLDEWIYFLKNEEIKGDVQAKGLKEAQDKLDIMKLPEEDRISYRQYLDDRHWQASRVLWPEERVEKAEQKLKETQTLLMTEREQAETQRRQKEEAQKREEEAQKQKEEAQKQKEELAEMAVTALMSTGMTREQARKQLGLD